MCLIGPSLVYARQCWCRRLPQGVRWLQGQWLRPLPLPRRQWQHHPQGISSFWRFFQFFVNLTKSHFSQIEISLVKKDLEKKIRKASFWKFLFFFKSASNHLRPWSWWRSPTSADVWSPRPVSVIWIVSPPWSSSPPPRSKCPSKERIKTTLSTTHPLWFDCWQTGARAFDSVNPLEGSTAERDGLNSLMSTSAF